MLCQQVNLLLDTLVSTGAQVAKYADVAPTRVSKLRSGAEAPAQGSSSIRQFVYGVIRMAQDTGQTEKLCALIGTPPESDDLEAKLTEWLYSDGETVTSRDEQRSLFMMRFRSVLECTGMSGRELSDASGVNYSYVLRMYHGDRFPRPGSEALLQMCAAVLEHEVAEKALLRLFALTHIPPELCTAEALRDWLFGIGDHTNTAALRQLITCLDQLGMPKRSKPQPIAPVTETGRMTYAGDAGLQDAVRRFLSNVRPGSRLYLYSDYPMDWMSGAFRQEWEALMQNCIRSGVRFRIVHNIDRSLPELLDAVRMWMPLYMTGLIEPYYSLRSCGDRFRHTFFIEPGNAVILGASPVCADAVFLYITEEDCVRTISEEFERFLTDDHRLLTVSQTPVRLAEDAVTKRFGNVIVSADRENAVIRKLTAPCLYFRFLHPEIVTSISRLLEGNGYGWRI